MVFVTLHTGHNNIYSYKGTRCGMKKTLIILSVLLISSLAYAENAAEVLSGLNKVQSYTADFIQKTEIEGFGSDTYSGRLYIKSRSRAFWDYQKPYRQFYIFDQTGMQFYDSEAKQLIRQQLDPSTNAYMRLMMNPADIKKDFTATFNSTTGKLILAPAAKNTGIDSMVFTIKNGQITGINTKDQNGNNTSIMFTNIKIDPQIPDSVFNPVIPKDTQIFSR